MKKKILSEFSIKEKDSNHRPKEGIIVSNKQNVLQRWSEYYEKHFELQEGTDSGSGEGWTMHINCRTIY
jgi:hypothetical protein